MEPTSRVVGPSNIHPDFNPASFHTDGPSADLDSHPTDGHRVAGLYGDSDAHATGTNRNSASATHR